MVKSILGALHISGLLPICGAERVVCVPANGHDAPISILSVLLLKRRLSNRKLWCIYYGSYNFHHQL